MLTIPLVTRATKLFVLVLVVAFACTAFAQHAAKDKPDAKNAPAAAVDEGSAQQVAVDKNGKFRAPTPEEVEALTKQMELMLSRPVEDLKIVALPIGGEAASTEGKFNDVIVMKTNPDRSTSQRCVSSKEELRDFLQNKEKKPVKAVRRDAHGLEVE